MSDKYRLLHRYWGYDTFRPLQEEIVDAVVQGHDVLALLPTGGGKSLCYQLPALLREGVCLVVSPLIALMKDQVQQLRNRKLKAACLVSGMSTNEMQAVLYNAIAGELKYLYVSPERLRQRMFIEHLRRMKVGLIAVDEAHCISQWGYDFRPPYLQIAEVRAYHPAAPLVALTATATPEVEEDICRQLLMSSDSRRFRASFARPNLSYEVWQGERMQRLLDVAGCGCGIVYVRNRRQTKTVADLLGTHGVSAISYHAGLDTRERDRRQQLWMEGKASVMVATNAFGMGIDKPDVRFVVHLGPPDSMEAYFQEAGRAGRDGLPARALLLAEAGDVERLETDIELDFPPVSYIRNIYKALCNYYRLPIGSGADTVHDFDFEALCNNYNLDPRRFYSACRFLEREGLVTLPEREDTASQLFIPLQRDELYRFQVNHMAMGNLLQVLLRLYPGLFSEPTPIDEEKVARQSLMQSHEVVALLGQMHAMHVVEYRPRPTKPQIIFPTARIDERDLHFADERYRWLKEAAQRRVASMKDYIANDRVCRSRQLLAYFGEVTEEDCGVCDVCRRRRNDLPPIDEAILQAVRIQRMQVSDLYRVLEAKGYDGVGEAVRRMLDRGVLYLDENLFVSSR